MRKYLYPQSGKFYKTNLHMHSTCSDGSMSPLEVKEYYQAHGYSVVAFSDHEVLVPHPELTDENFLAITATEISMNKHLPGKMHWTLFKCYHLNLFSRDPNKNVYTLFNSDFADRPSMQPFIPAEQRKLPDYPRRYEMEYVNKIIADAKADGFLVSFNHPAWSLQDYTDYADLEGIWGVEVYNTSSDVDGIPDTVQPFEDMLRLGKRIFPLATDDSHSKIDACGGWTMIKADKLDYASVIAAMEKGDLYASNGPEIKELYFEDDKIHLECSPAARVYMNSDRRFYKRVLAEDKPITSVDFELSYLHDQRADKDFYVRFTVVDEKGKTAWSRAFFIDELLK